MKIDAVNAHKAAQNLYAASRALPLTAEQHELLGTSHDLLHSYINAAEQQAAKLAEMENENERLQLRELKNQGGAT